MLKSILKMPFYAVARGRNVGIYLNWSDCQREVSGFQAAKFKKFPTQTEAEDFLRQHGSGNVMPQQPFSSGPKLKKTNIHSKSPETSVATTSLKRPLTKPVPETPSMGSMKRTKFLEEIPKQTNEFQIGDHTFIQNDDGYVQVYTDGSCEGNGKANACAGLGVYFGENHKLNLAQAVNGRATNNCGEIQASIEAIRLAKSNGIQKLQINTDSKFLIDAVTKWMPGWKKKDWKTASGGAVKNKEDFVRLDTVMKQNAIDIRWQYVAAHVGILGNERADALARKGAEEYRQLFKGNLDGMFDDF